jgi:hypothetical protein
VNYLRSTTCIRIPIIISIHVLNVDPIGHVLTQNQHVQVLDEEQGPQGSGEDISGWWKCNHWPDSECNDACGNCGSHS